MLTYTLENHIEKEHTEKMNVQQRHDSEKNQSPKSDSKSLNHETDFRLNYKNNVKYFENKGKKPFQSQRPTMKLNKRSLPKPTTTTG